MKGNQGLEALGAVCAGEAAAVETGPTEGEAVAKAGEATESSSANPTTPATTANTTAPSNSATTTGNTGMAAMQQLAYYQYMQAQASAVAQSLALSANMAGGVNAAPYVESTNGGQVAGISMTGQGQKRGTCLSTA